MTHISLKNAGVEFPIYNAANRSLKNEVLKIATGGTINRRDDGLTVIRGLKDVNLEIRHGDRLGLVGHNGSGKTTLLRVLSGIYRPSSGRAMIEGNCTSLIDINLGIDPEATGRENIFLRAAMMKIKRAELAKKIDNIIEFTGLGDFIEMPMRTYSTGMQLRLAFAISTSVNPEILIMDEWLSTGDEDFRVKADQRLREIVDNTQILVLASHSRDLLHTNCNRIIWLEHGSVKLDGDPTEVLQAYFSGL